MNNIQLSATLKIDAEYRATLKRPPQHILDKIADDKISGGYKIGKKQICKSCNMAKYANGTCSCDY